MFTKSINELKHLFPNHVYKETQTTLEELLYSRLMKYIDIEPMKRSRKWRCIACDIVVWSHNMMHARYITEGSMDMPFFTVNKICRGKTFSRTLINIIVCFLSETKAVQNTNHVIYRKIYRKISTDTRSPDIFIFDGVLEWNRNSIWANQKAPPSPSASSTLKHSAFDGPKKQSPNALCSLPKKWTSSLIRPFRSSYDSSELWLPP